MNKRFCIVIPAYNEAATISEVVAGAVEYAPVLVVDDGSSDDTAERARAAGATVLVNAENAGKAASLWRGMVQAMNEGADAVITMDADAQHDPAELPRLQGAHITFPQRVILGARLRERHATPPLRLFGNRMANFWISWAAGHPVADSQTGYRVYPTELLGRLKPAVARERSFVFESEILIEAARLGYPTEPVPITAIYRPTARASYYRGGLDTWRIVRMVGGKLLARGMYPQGLWRSLRPPRPARPEAADHERTH
ncbi:glycosyltransferase family 2 protein [Alkalilimnicola sp. S0819]|uniref:glycosyltransferase family 2 protein n=1 Tax=Alkalilimnicola sp. S0819 TaxID=2613922 RepID=UPI001261F368|nr:glycosyltransferase family 2 protein [Alkalilimnicola sp. S0819]KAB7624185.1 glycosyltransferase family 2 protein [Alkalilimnicola sp. S0819]MPQ16440.1 glycosyltransferase [Alkalilimnicola sp. S0819]